MAKKKNSVLLIGLILILVLAMGLSYGYYLLNRVQENNNIVGSKCFNLEFINEKNAINLDNMYPISDEEGRKLTPYSFTITNTCDMLAGYTVNMEMLEGTTLNSKYLDVMVNNEQIKLLTNYESTNTVITGSTESRILAKGTLAYNDSVDYTVRFWMDKDVEDTESMNKLFKSKIVISATPSSWNPKDAGYDTLYDAILANEYQTTPADAISKIGAKGEPDLSQTAPVIRWVEKTGNTTTVTSTKPASTAIKNDDQMSDLTETDTKIALFTTKTFNSATGRYSLSNPVYVDPTEVDFSGDTKYYFQTESMSYNQTNKKMYVNRGWGDITIYQVTGATKTTGTAKWNNVSYDSITYNLNVITLTETELETDNSDKGLYQTIDDYGTTYYYRGNVKNNIVQFAGFYWQIVRINGDGSIRLIYNGTEKNASGNRQMINNTTVAFNTKYNAPTYIGYMYGNPDGTTFDEVHNNTNNSTIKTAVDNWYKTNIADKGYSSYVSNAVGFCGDRTLTGGDGISTSIYSYFGAYERYSKNAAQLTCPNKERDLYTTTDSNVGNNSLTYPIGLITYDELVFAGMDGRHINKLSYIYSNKYYWTMSPSIFSATGNRAYIWSENNMGYMLEYWIANDLGARPVINLKSDTLITSGIGTSSDPFVVH